MKIELRPYQLEAVEQTRQVVRGGARSALINAPTGSGKTAIASHMIDECRRKGRRAAFVTESLSLIQQTSETFYRYGINHGVIQADHPGFNPSLPVQLCSAQTLASRGCWPPADLIVVDEAHIVTEVVKKRIALRDAVFLGLTATPFKDGLRQIYETVINVTTTNQLIRDGFLAPYRIYACAEPDMTGVKVAAGGEWEQKGAQEQALKVVGCVTAEYLKHGKNRKFICSAVDTAHVQELQRQFLAAGINVATYTYKDRDEDRADTVAEFRRPDSSIRGLITVTAASKGFDVPDIGCVIMARPLRKSLAEHIQFLGRGLRIAPGKSDCIILDHSGNCARFWADTNHFFEFGVSELSDGKRREKAKPQPKPEAEPVKCPSCGHLHRPMPHCPSCGHEYPKRAAVQHVPGTLKELVATGDQMLLRRQLWPQVCWYVHNERKPKDDSHAQRMAQAIYASLTGSVAMARYSTTTPVECTPEVFNKILNEQIRFARSQRRFRRDEGARA